jgi:hypothetical protein
MTKSMTKSKTLAAALAALTLGTALIATSSDVQARPRFGAGLGIGLAVGVLAAAAATSSAYAGSAYVIEPGYAYGYRCRYVERVNPWGFVRTVKICRSVLY